VKLFALVEAVKAMPHAAVDISMAGNWLLTPKA
jgi:hypothetical protein